MKYIISIDGGGTKTLGVLFDKSGTEIARSENGFSNFSVDVEISKASILTTIEQLVKHVKTEEIITIQIGVAGYSNFEDSNQFVRGLEEKYNCSIEMGTDASLAYYSVKRDSDLDVVMVLGGTGSVVTYEKDDSIRFVGGFGHILGDQGSAYHLVINALKNVIRQQEQGKIISKLSKDILKELHTDDYNDIKLFVYNNQKKQIAKLSKFIAEKAMENDKEAIKLFIDEGVYLSQQAIDAVHLLQSTNTILIGIKGGFFQHAPYVKETFIQEFKKSGIDYKIDERDIEPVYGGYYLALKRLSSEEVCL
jgi:N-acetylglucosamine kinase-like BadF-type ATPase